MRSLAVGSIAAAILMFALGFVFFGVLGMMMFNPASPEAAAAVQAALGQNFSVSGAYMVPADEAAWMAGPSAVVNFVAAGDAPGMTMAMIEGFLHFLVSALLIAMALKAVGGDAMRQMKAMLWFGIAASVFMHLGDPIWYGYGWRMTLFEFVCDAIMFIAGGLVLAKWFTSERLTAAA